VILRIKKPVKVQAFGSAKVHKVEDTRVIMLSNLKNLIGFFYGLGF